MHIGRHLFLDTGRLRATDALKYISRPVVSGHSLGPNVNCGQVVVWMLRCICHFGLLVQIHTVVLDHLISFCVLGLETSF